MMHFNARSLYGSAARFDVTRGMTEDEIRRVAPSVFALEAHESRSERFQPIPTIEVIRGLEREGFYSAYLGDLPPLNVQAGFRQEAVGALNNDRTPLGHP